MLRSIQSDLLKGPYRGRLVRGLGGVRKGRAASPARGKGKRGGYRYFYLYLEHRDRIHLLLLLDKKEQEDLHPAQRTAVRELVRQITQEEVVSG